MPKKIKTGQDLFNPIDIFSYEDTDEEEIQVTCLEEHSIDLMFTGISENTVHVLCLMPKEKAIKLAKSILLHYEEE